MKQLSFSRPQQEHLIFSKGTSASQLGIPDDFLELPGIIPGCVSLIYHKGQVMLPQLVKRHEQKPWSLTRNLKMDENRHLEKKIPNLETIIFRFQPLNFRSVKCRFERCIALNAYRILPISLWLSWATYLRGRCQLCSNRPKSCHQKDGTNDDHTGPMETTVRLTYDLQVIYASIVIPKFGTATLGSNLKGHTLLHTPWILCTTSIC